jgi:hypothetical protein
MQSIMFLNPFGMRLSGQVYKRGLFLFHRRLTNTDGSSSRSKSRDTHLPENPADNGTGAGRLLSRKYLRTFTTYYK